MSFNFINEATTIVDLQGNAAISLQSPDIILITGQTVGAVTETLLTYDLGSSAGMYTFFILIGGYSTTTGESTCERALVNITTNGSTGTFVDESDRYATNIAGSGVSMAVSGNSGLVQAIGSAGHTINWRMELNFIFAS